MLGLSKYLMETKLNKLRDKNIFVSSVRFANVAFSNGSILKYVVDRVLQKKSFGVPKDIRRYFITHGEASSLCFKSLLKRNNRKVLIPSFNTLNKDYLLTDLVEKILTEFDLKTKFLKIDKIKKNYKNKTCYILLTSISDGQKKFEEFYSKNEKIIKDVDKTVCKVNLPRFNKKFDIAINKILKFRNIQALKKFLGKEFKNYQSPKKFSKVSQTI